MAYFPQDVHEFDITQFQGSAQSVDPYALDPSHGLYTQNTDFVIGTGEVSAPLVQASTRRGSSQVAQIPNSDGAVTSLFAWYLNLAGVQDCYAVYFTPAAGAKFYSQVSTSFATIVAAGSLTNSPKEMSFATDGIRCYLAFSDITGRYSACSGWIYNASTTNVDKLFAQPIATSVVTVAASNSGAGVCTV